MKMNIKEKFLEIEVLHDEKTRRVLNVDPDTTPNIKIENLLDGITVENLDTINVPVLRYGTQITIHGVFPDKSKDYLSKGLIFNGNKSLGVRYSSIDLNKKLILNTVSRFSITGWKMFINSTECYIAKPFYKSADNDNLEKLYNEAVVEYNKSTFDNYIGSKYIAKVTYPYVGTLGFLVVINIGMIYQKDLWDFSKFYFGLNEPEYLIKENEKTEIQKQRAIEAKEKRVEGNQLLINAVISLKNQFEKPTQLSEGYYIGATLNWNSTIYYSVLKVKFDNRFKRWLVYKREFSAFQDVEKFTPYTYEKAKVYQENQIIANYFVLK